MDYFAIHDSIIKRAKERILEGYSEKHHIVPKCMGGDNNKDNLVNLTAREHYLIHLLLTKMYPNNESLIRAAFMMCHVKNKINHKRTYSVSSRQYEVLRESYSRVVSKQFKGKNKTFSAKHKKSLSEAALRRAPKTTEQRESQSETMKKKYSSPEGVKIKEAISRTLSGKPKSLEHNAKVAIANKGRKYLYNPHTMEVRKVKGDLVDSLLNEGWLFGRKPKQNV